jgi:hypothetical protein
MGRVWMLIALAGVVGLSAAPAAATPFASSLKATTVSAYGDTVVWSTYDQTSKRYWLTAKVGDQIARLPVGSRRVPFDVDLGRGPSGGVVAAYSRCTHEPDYILASGSLPQPNYSRGQGCDIYRYDFATRRESKVALVSGAATSEFMPSIWKDRIAFARVYERRHGRAGAVTWVYTRALSGRGRSTRVPGGIWG